MVNGHHPLQECCPITAELSYTAYLITLLQLFNLTLSRRCKLNFAKAGYWSSKRHEFFGSVFNADGKVTHQISGKWNEFFNMKPTGNAGSPSSGANGRVIWRPGALPEDADLYYGFSRFAIELNELDPAEREVLPPTDSR